MDAHPCMPCHPCMPDNVNDNMMDANPCHASDHMHDKMNDAKDKGMNEAESWNPCAADHPCMPSFGCNPWNGE